MSPLMFLRVLWCRRFGHDWTSWMDVFESFEDRTVIGRFRGCCRCGESEDAPPTGTYLSERHGDTYQVRYIDADGHSELIAEGTCDPDQIARRIADIEADHRRTREQQETDDE